jgi:hypothetical protein
VSSISKPHQIVSTQPLCPVCGKASYSASGIHPQCNVTRNDKVRTKSLKSKAAPKPKTAATPWLKRCPKCSRQVAARRHTCDCGHQFPQSAGG